MFARRSELAPCAIDPVQLVAELRDVFTHTLSPAISLVVDLAPDLPHIFVNQAELETALVNLAVNAQDAMPDGGVLRIAAHPVSAPTENALPPDLAPGLYVCLSVSDSGLGMDRETLARASEPFFTTKPMGKGTGLGLSMVHGFATQSGGTMTLASEAGRGTTVALYLPAAPPSLTHSTASEPDMTDRRPARTESVFLVDDDVSVREVLSAELAQAGFTVVEAASGEAALQLVDSGLEFDVLVTDLAMPRMDGIALIRAIGVRRPHARAIILTGNAGAGASLAIGGALPSVTLLRKPIAGQELADQIAALLEPAAS